MDTRNNRDRPSSVPPPSVGIFWVVLERGGHLALIADAVPVADAEDYGEFRTYGGHYEFWAELGAAGAGALRRRGLPAAPVWSEYEEWPRGRVVHHVPSGRFVLYLDVRLRRKPFIAMIAARFGLTEGAFDVRGDAHYVSVRGVG